MKKSFILFLLLGFVSLRAFACGPESPNYDAYVFRLCPNPNYYSHNNDMRLAQAWSQLIGTKVTVAQSRQLADITLAELDTLGNPIARYAKKNKEVNDYLRLLVRYLQAANMVSRPWDYPSPEELSNYQSQLTQILSQASQYKGQQMQERYQLLRMRILFRQNEFGALIQLWEQHPLNSGSVFADMARDLYAGALYHLGRPEDAAVQYALSGNMFDAHQCMRYMHGTSCMNRIIQSDPNSPVLPYMLEEIVNGCAESFRFFEVLSIVHPLIQLGACLPWQRISEIHVPYYCYDWEQCPDGFARITRAPSSFEWFQEAHSYEVNENEAMMLEVIVERQLANAKVKDRCMWLSAQAYLQYLKKNDAAWNTIEQAVKAPGSDISKQNAQFLRMLIVTRHPDLKVMERTLAASLAKIPNMPVVAYVDSSADGSYHYWLEGPAPVSNEECFAHLVRHGIVERYLLEGDSIMASLAWSLLSSAYLYDEGDADYHFLPSSGGEHYNTFCRLSHANQIKMLGMIQQPKKVKSPLAQYILSKLPYSVNNYLDAIGTNYLRDGLFAEAIPYLEQVPLTFLSRQPIAPYAAIRSFRDTPWEKKYVEEGIQYGGGLTLTTNAKVDYCRAVIEAQKQYAHSTGEAHTQAAYALGQLYHQASVLGYCWWLAYYGVSLGCEICNEDLYKGHFDFVLQSRRLLEQAMDSPDAATRFKAGFLLIHQGQPTLTLSEWNADDYSYTVKVNTQSQYYPSLLRFMMELYLRNDAPAYVTHCDYLAEMRGMMR